jgi:hypothetical protein
VLRTAKDVLASDSIEAVVDFAIEVNREVVSLSKELEAVKPFLRDEGMRLAALNGTNSAELVGNMGAATIVGVKPSPKPKRGMDLASLEAVLPPEVFYSLFTKKVVVTVEIADSYESKLGLLTAQQRAVLANYIEVVGATPRVNLPK